MEKSFQYEAVWSNKTLGFWHLEKAKNNLKKEYNFFLWNGSSEWLYMMIMQQEITLYDCLTEL